MADLIGLYGTGTIATGYFWYLGNALAFNFGAHHQATLPGNPLQSLVIVASWTSFCIGLALTTTYFIRTTDSIRSLLRNSRKDKRTIAEEVHLRRVGGYGKYSITHGIVGRGRSYQCFGDNRQTH